MKSIMTSFKVNKEVTNGNCIYNAKCPICNYENEVSIYNKLNMQKKRTVQCAKCLNYYTIGEIYNFKTGGRLYQRLDNRFNSNEYDKNDWHNAYINI